MGWEVVPLLSRVSVALRSLVVPFLDMVSFRVELFWLVELSHDSPTGSYVVGFMVHDWSLFELADRSLVSAEELAV